jgi:gliding motility-associated-like protein
MFYRFLLLFVSLPCFAQSQCLSNKGKEFYVACFQKGKLYMTSNENTNGVIFNPNTQMSINFSITANNFTEVNTLATESLISDNNLILNRGLIVKSEKPISVMFITGQKASSDAALIYPIETLGTEYIVTSWGRTFATNNFNFASAGVIIATENNTVIEIKPNCELSNNHPINIPFFITLNKGQIYAVAGKEDISGTFIRVTNGNKPIAVFCGQRGAPIPFGFNSADQLYEQITPITKLGNEFITPILKGRGKNILKFVSAFDSCEINIDGNYITTINKAQVFKYETNNTHKFIKSSKLLQVALFGTSYTYDSLLLGNIGDPTFLIVQPLQQMVKHSTFAAPKFDSILSHKISIICKTSAVNNTFFDSINIGNLFVPILAIPSYSAASLDIAQGAHVLNNVNGFIAYANGYGFRQAYSYCVGSSVNEVFKPTHFICNGKSSADSSQVKICLGDTAFFEILNQNNNISYSWNYGDSSSNVNTSNATIRQRHHFSKTGNYVVSLNVTNCNGDFETRKLKINIYKPFVGFRNLDTTISSGSYLTLAPIVNNDITKYVWSPNYQINNVQIATPLVNPLLSTKYIVDVTDSLGCKAVNSFLVKIYEGFYMPSTFTPNGDGKNDFFKITNSVFMKKVTFFIYNRWGQLVFKTNDKEKGWDGFFNNVKVPVGVYVWQINYDDSFDIKRFVYGNVLLVE